MSRNPLLEGVRAEVDGGARRRFDLLDLLRTPSWHADAACKEHPDVEFFPERGESAEPALAVCAACLVLDECRSVAVQQRIEHGVWGGTTANQRLRTLFKADRQRRSTKRTITTNDPGGNPCNP